MNAEIEIAHARRDVHDPKSDTSGLAHRSIAEPADHRYVIEVVGR
jgi:hypothetical protein